MALTGVPVDQLPEPDLGPPKRKDGKLKRGPLAMKMGIAQMKILYSRGCGWECLGCGKPSFPNRATCIICGQEVKYTGRTQPFPADWDAEEDAAYAAAQELQEQAGEGDLWDK